MPTPTNCSGSLGDKEDKMTILQLSGFSIKVYLLGMLVIVTAVGLVLISFWIAFRFLKRPLTNKEIRRLRRGTKLYFHYFEDGRKKVIPCHVMYVRPNDEVLISTWEINEETNDIVSRYVVAQANDLHLWN